MNELIQKMQQIDEIKNGISTVIASTGEEVPSFAEYPASLQQIADERSTLISDYQEFKSTIEDQLGEENEEKNDCHHHLPYRSTCPGNNNTALRI